MTNHDPLCNLEEHEDVFFCVCEFIAKVRADEQAKRIGFRDSGTTAVAAYRVDLRAKVEALRDEASENYHIGPATKAVLLEGYGKVLALINGSSDEQG